jgi:nucleotide-binding universal stress UspA family protein
VVLSNTSDEVLRAMFGPVIMIGSCACDSTGRLDGTYVVPLDGSNRAAGVLPVVAAWSLAFDAVPCVVEVLDEGEPWFDGSEATPSVAGSALALRRRTERPVESALLHARHASTAIVAFAAERCASLIFMATHGRTGLARLRSGSTAASVLHHATCPVVMFRPAAPMSWPEVAHASEW